MTIRYPLLLCGLLFSGLTQAAPVLYTFSGMVTFVEDFDGVIAETYPGVDFVDMPIEYVISVDTELPGSAVTFGGDIEVTEDFSDPGVFSLDSAFAELVSGSLVEQTDGFVSKDDPGGYAQINWAFTFRIDDPFEITSTIDVGSDDDLLSIRMNPALGIPLADWATGMTFMGAERIFASDRFAWGEVQTDLVLTDISVSAVPVPAAVWLFGSALIGVAGFCKRRPAA